MFETHKAFLIGALIAVFGVTGFSFLRFRKIHIGMAAIAVGLLLSIVREILQVSPGAPLVVRFMYEFAAPVGIVLILVGAGVTLRQVLKIHASTSSG